MMGKDRILLLLLSFWSDLFILITSSIQLATMSSLSIRSWFDQLLRRCVGRSVPVAGEVLSNDTDTNNSSYAMKEEQDGVGNRPIPSSPGLPALFIGHFISFYT